MAKLGNSGIFGGMSGRLGNAVLVRRADGTTIVRQRVTPRDPQTPAQTAARIRMTVASRAWAGLTAEQQLEWWVYARSLSGRRGSRGYGNGPNPFQLFSGLACKVLQVDPQAEVPTSPPAREFQGDAVYVTVSASVLATEVRSGIPRPSGRGSVSKVNRGEGAGGPGPKPARQDPPPGVVFTADRPNAPGVVTELLLQPVSNPLRHPARDKYRTQAFFAYTEGSLTTTVSVTPGAYAAAVRFVDPATGQASELWPVGTVVV